MGALVTLKLPDSPAADLPWIITFGPLDEDEDWEPVVCGPYERPHAVALAEAIVADEELLAVIEPLLPRVSAEEIRHEISEAQRQAAEVMTVSAEEYGMNDARDEDGPDGADGTASYDDGPDGNGYADERSGLGADYRRPPDPNEVRAGFARIAARLTGRSDG